MIAFSDKPLEFQLLHFQLEFQPEMRGLLVLEFQLVMRCLFVLKLHLRLLQFVLPFARLVFIFSLLTATVMFSSLHLQMQTLQFQVHHRHRLCTTKDETIAVFIGFWKFARMARVFQVFFLLACGTGHR
jgi:hypothetical protein